MPCCTYLDDCRIKQIRESLTDVELRELLDEANALDDGGWLIQQQTHEVGRLWWKREVVRFTLYWHTVSTEYQVINLMPNDPDASSIQLQSNRSAVGSFLIGYLGGRREAKV